AEVANLRDYYGYLAADRAVQSYNLNVHETTDDEKTQEILAADPGIVRAHELFECDMVEEAGAEWNAVLGTARPAVKIQAARLASRWTWYAQTIATLAQAGAWDDVPLRYPRPYFSLVADAAKLADVPVDWIYSIMRQESLFRRDAVSRADARGLMQMQPATALAVAKRWHLPAPTRQELFDPAVALPLGALHVRELLNRYSGQLDQSLAAYNAGPMAVARWMPTGPIDADIWVENVPYTETRNYIQHIFEHIVAFAAVRGDQPPRLSAMMPKIDPQATLPLSDGRR
ncbi:MAG: transglycosylase SLT domain-containing protein, partial [Pseudomonadota bacterium]|nr:transglycosylase SLT domain-containing protein [Pseudomonadota bacterium]